MTKLNSHITSPLTGTDEPAEVSVSEGSSADDAEVLRSDRRGFVRRLGMAAGAVAAGGALVATNTEPAAAWYGENLRVGVTSIQDLPYPSGIRYDSQYQITNDVFRVQTTNHGTSPYPSAVAGYGGPQGIGHGVLGYTEGASGYGVVGWGNASGCVGVRAEGRRANMHLAGWGDAAPKRSDRHETGDVLADGFGTLWLCVTGGQPGTWRRLGSTDSAGALSMLDVPERVYDSRQATEAWTQVGALSAGQRRDVYCTVRGAVPKGATAAMLNVTVTGTSAAGFLTIWRRGATQPATSNINWFQPNSNLANGMTVALDGDAACTVLCGGSGAKTHFIVDVVGYYR